MIGNRQPWNLEKKCGIIKSQKKADAALKKGK